MFGIYRMVLLFQSLARLSALRSDVSPVKSSDPAEDKTLSQV